MSKDGFVAFCCASIEAQVVKAFESDHVFAFARIKERQEALLECLNEPNNQAFTDAFLKTPGIEKYFRKDSIDNKIKGTKRFFYDCFNDVSNLLPITHLINREKSDRSTKEWFKEVFPPQLIQELEETGDIQEGIVIDRVLNKKGMPEFQIGEVKTAYSTKDPKIENIQVHVHKGDCKGLGDFVAEWFNARPRISEGAEKVHSLKEDLTKLLQKSIAEERNNETVAFEKTMEFISDVLTVTQDYVNHKIEIRSQDSEKQAEFSKGIFRDNFRRFLKDMGTFKDAKDLAVALVCEKGQNFEEQSRKVKDSLYDYVREVGLFNLDPQAVEDALRNFHETLSKMNDHRKGPISIEEIKQILLVSKDKADPRQHAAFATMRADEEAARANAEALGRQEEAEGRQIAEARANFYKTIAEIHKTLNKASGKIEAIQEYFMKHQNE